MVGQLGHGDTAAYKAPRRVDSLLGIPIQQVACGEDFTLCVSGWCQTCIMFVPLYLVFFSHMDSLFMVKK